MKPRIGVRPIAGASTGLLLLLLVWFLLHQQFRSAPPVAPAPSAVPAPATIAPPIADTIARGGPVVPPARARTAVPPAVRVGVGLHWAGGRTRKKVAGEMPPGGGVIRKTTIAVEATVSASGRVTKLSVLQGTRNAGMLDRTLKAVRSWRFESLPASRKGAAERCRITLTFRPPGG